MKPDANRMTGNHEHYFSTAIDEDVDDITGRFNAVETDEAGWVFCVSNRTWIKVKDYETAKGIAKLLADSLVL